MNVLVLVFGESSREIVSATPDSVGEFCTEEGFGGLRGSGLQGLWPFRRGIVLGKDRGCGGRFSEPRDHIYRLLGCGSMASLKSLLWPSSSLIFFLLILSASKDFYLWPQMCENGTPNSARKRLLYFCLQFIGNCWST